MFPFGPHFRIKEICKCLVCKNQGKKSGNIRNLALPIIVCE